MENKVKAPTAIYPYSRMVSSLIRYSHLIEEYSITSVISTMGFMMDEEDISTLEKREKSGVLCTTSFAKGIEQCNVVIIAEMDCPDSFRAIIVKNIICAMEQGKRIVNLFHFTTDQEQLLSELAGIYGTDYISCRTWYAVKPEYDNTFLETYAPIILVAGLSEDCGKFELQLIIRNYLINSGYRVSQIGTKHYSEMFGFHSFPSFMFDTSTDIGERINGLNTYVRKIERNESPQVIVIGIPGGLMPLNTKLHQEYGKTTFEVGYALQPDYCILVTQAMSELDLDAVCQKAKALLGLDPCCIAMSNLRLNQEAALTGYQGMSSDILSLTELDEVINTKRNQMRIPLVNICKEHKEGILKDFLNHLVDEYYAPMYVPSFKNIFESETDDFAHWLKETIYKLFPTLNRSLGIEQNWKELSASDLLYVLAEIAIKTGIIISSDEIKKGATRSYSQFLNVILSRTNPLLL